MNVVEVLLAAGGLLLVGVVVLVVAVKTAEPRLRADIASVLDQVASDARSRRHLRAVPGNRPGGR